MRPSARLTRAVAAERADLERERSRLLREASELRAALAQIELGLAEIDERRALLDRLAPPREVEARTPVQAPRALRGPAIREAAVAVLVSAGLEALHYRDWFDLLAEQGHEVAGKDPLAVFLTQLNRSPAVRKGASPGVYVLDHDAPRRLQQQLDDLRDELKRLTAQPNTKLSAVADLTARISKAERALEEATRALSPQREAA
jgi:septal ring factor EnvC (AmiA/AmiB activator)